MKVASMATAAVIGLTLCGTGVPARAGKIQAAPTPIDISARKKVRHKAPVVDSRSPYYHRPGVAPSFGYIGPPGYAGEYAWRKSIGQCVEDLGYGRWAPCGYR